MKRNRSSAWSFGVCASILSAAAGTGIPATAQESRPASSPESRPAERAGAGWPALGNGLRWRCLPLAGARHVGMFLWFRIGGDHDPAERTGLAHLMEHLLATSATATTPVRSYEQLARTHKLGASGVTRSRCTLVWSLVATEAMEQDLAWFAGILGSLRLGEEDLVRERLSMLAEVERMTADLPGGILQWRGRAALFPNDSRGRTLIGVPEQARAITLADVLERRKRCYTPRNALLLLVGGITEAEARPLVERLFAAIPGGPEDAPPVRADVALSAPPLTEEYEKVGGPFVTAAFRAPPVDHADHPAFLAAAAVLAARATATFLREDRQGAASFRGRGREAEAFFPPVHYPFLESPDALFVNCRGPDGAPMSRPREEIEEWLRELASAQPDPTGLQMAKRANETQVSPWPAPAWIRGQAVVMPQVLHAIGTAVGMQEFLRVPADYGRRFAAVTSADIARVAELWLPPEKATWLALLPKRK